ncbi:MAG: TrkA family potassium uptake protein [Coriobacteriales bacterium]|nr:TrkA family potassium uptake protein [Coriobacteriales bacterium]
MNIIVVGCGRVGSQLATLFSQEDNNIVVIDNDQQSFSNLGRNFEGRTLVGVGFDEEVLLDAGVEECDVLAAVTDQDNSNLMIAEMGRKLFGVPHVLTRLYNPDRESAYMQLGLDYVCGTTLVAEEIYSKIAAKHGSHVDTFGDYEVLRFALNLSDTEKKAIQVSELERDHEIRIIAFERKDQSLSSIPTKDSILYHGDIVLACVRRSLLEHIGTYMSQ